MIGMRTLLEVADNSGARKLSCILPRGGDLGFVEKDQTVAPFEKAAFALAKPNDLSPVVESDFGYHIIQLVEKRPEGVVPFADAKEKIANFLKQKQSQEKVQGHIQELRTKGKVEIFI